MRRLTLALLSLPAAWALARAGSARYPIAEVEVDSSGDTVSATTYVQGPGGTPLRGVYTDAADTSYHETSWYGAGGGFPDSVAYADSGALWEVDRTSFPRPDSARLIYDYLDGTADTDYVRVYGAFPWGKAPDSMYFYYSDFSLYRKLLFAKDSLGYPIRQIDVDLDSGVADTTRYANTYGDAGELARSVASGADWETTTSYLYAGAGAVRRPPRAARPGPVPAFRGRSADGRALPRALPRHQ